MNTQTAKVVIAVVIYAVTTAISVAVFHNRGIGWFIDGALLLGFFYYLASLARQKQS